MYKKIGYKVIIIMELILCSSLLMSCRDNEPDTPEKMSFMERSDHGYYREVSALFVDDGDIDLQDCINKNRYQYRIQTNDQISFLNLRFSSAPRRLNSYVDMELEYQHNDTYIAEAIEMRIVKVDGSTIWLWNSKDLIGVIIPRF